MTGAKICVKAGAAPQVIVPVQRGYRSSILMLAGKGQALVRRKRAFAALRRGDSRSEASRSAGGETHSGSP
jgi:hypothetical protein